MKYSGTLLTGIAAIMLSACSYSSINPEAALADIRANSGYDELQDIEPGTTRIVLRTAAGGSGYPAHFSVSTSSQNCQDFKSLGNTAWAGRGVVYPWIANATQRGRRTQPYLVHEAKPDEPIQVRSYGSWADGTGSGFRSGHCGPVTARFTPQEGHAYIAEFAWGNTPPCSMTILDATQRDAPVPIAAQVVESCPVPSR